MSNSNDNNTFEHHSLTGEPLNNQTFKSNAQVLKRLESKSRQIENWLSSDHMRDSNERKQYLLENLSKTQHEISEQLFLCRTQAPREALSNYNQFGDGEKLSIRFTPDDLADYTIEKALEINNDILDELSHLTSTDQTEVSNVMLNNLKALVSLKLRGMSMALQTANDI